MHLCSLQDNSDAKHVLGKGDAAVVRTPVRSPILLKLLERQTAGVCLGKLWPGGGMESFKGLVRPGLSLTSSEIYTTPFVVEALHLSGILSLS